MKLKYSFEAINMGEEIIFVPVGEGSAQVHGVLKLNPQGQEILELLEKETTIDQIVETLSAKYNNSKNDLVDYVNSVLDVLRDANLLNE